MKCASRAAAAVLLAACLAAAGAQAQRLTLEEVLAHADQPHPDLDLARARHDGAVAEARLADSLNDFRVTLDASLRSGRNALYDDQFRPDHFARLNARRTLFDSGRQQAAGQAAVHERDAQAAYLLDARGQRRLTLMTRFFDLLLAEMRDVAETERMAVAWVEWDKAKDRHDVGELAQWRLAELEARFQEALAQRNEVRRSLREKRLALAQAMNRQGMLLDELVDPALRDNDRKLPDWEVLLAAVREHSPRLRAQRELLAGARQRINGARMEYRPSIEFEAEAAAWKREATARDDLRAGINFVWPLWQGGRADARVAREQARLHELQAGYERDLHAMELALRDTWEEIQWLRSSARRDAELRERHRDLALERARAEYEMELKTDIGNSMAETQVARLNRRAVEYRLALAWARLEAMLGSDPAALAPSTTAHKEQQP